MTTTGPLVNLQILEADDFNFEGVDLLRAAARVAVFEFNAVDRSEDFQPDRRHTHPQDVPRFLPDIEIAGGTRITVVTDRVSADEQILNPRRAQQP